MDIRKLGLNQFLKWLIVYLVKYDGMLSQESEHGSKDVGANQLVLFVTYPGQAVCVCVCVRDLSNTCWSPAIPYPALNVCSTDRCFGCTRFELTLQPRHEKNEHTTLQVARKLRVKEGEHAHFECGWLGGGGNGREVEVEPAKPLRHCNDTMESFFWKGRLILHVCSQVCSSTDPPTGR